MKPQWPKSKQRQLWALLNALTHGERLTVLTAIRKYGIYALSQRCGQLRRLHWPIRSKMIRIGKKCVAQYWMVRA